MVHVKIGSPPPRVGMVVASDIVFGQWQPAMLSGLKEKLDLHCFERKDNSPVFGTVNDPGCRRAFKTTQVCALNFTQGL